MANVMPDQNPSFEVLPLLIAGAWAVQVTWPDGKTEEVKGFASKEMANGWVNGHGAQEWLAQRRIIDD